MPDTDIASSCSSLLTPAEEYLRYPTYGEHIGSTTFDLCDADDTLLAHQHGACSWAERDAHAGALAAAAAADVNVVGYSADEGVGATCIEAVGYACITCSTRSASYRY